MRRTGRSIVVLFLALLSSVVLGVASALTAAITLAATALIVPGTGTPDANIVDGYRQNARDYYMQATPCNNVDNCPDTSLIGIDYPASFWPIPLPGWCEPGRCEKWNVSVGEGVDGLDDKLNYYLDNTDEDIVIFGYSQGAAVVSNELRKIATTLTQEEKDRISVVLIGNPDNPAGGLFTRLAFLGHVPILDATFGLATPIDTGIPFTSIRFEYDGVSHAPKYWGNPLAVANALLGFQYVHGTMLEPNENSDFTGLPNGYTKDQLLEQMDCEKHPGNCRYDDYGNTYITIPTLTLPIVRPFLDLAAATGTTPLVKPIVDLVSPTLRVLINLGYDPDENPGILSPLSILPFNPFLNPFQLAVDLIAAAVQGVEAAFGDLGAPAVIAPTPAPLSGTQTEMMAASRFADPSPAGAPATGPVSELKKSAATPTPDTAAPANDATELKDANDATALKDDNDATALKDDNDATELKDDNDESPDATKPKETKASGATQPDPAETTGTVTSIKEAPKKTSTADADRPGGVGSKDGDSSEGNDSKKDAA